MSATEYFITNVFGSSVVFAVVMFFFVLLVLTIIDANKEVKVVCSALYLIGVSGVYLPKWVFALVLVFAGVIFAIYVKKLFIRNE